jgi:hypothetical protein
MIELRKEVAVSESIYAWIQVEGRKSASYRMSVKYGKIA